MKIGDIVDEKILRGVLAKNILVEGYILPREIIKNLVQAILNLEVKLTIDVEKILEIVKEFAKESSYGRNFCNSENIPRNPNSIGCCDYCGGIVRLQTFAQALKNLF